MARVQGMGCADGMGRVSGMGCGGLLPRVGRGELCRLSCRFYLRQNISMIDVLSLSLFSVLGVLPGVPARSLHPRILQAQQSMREYFTAAAMVFRRRSRFLPNRIKSS